jgi:hypothetical protein
VVSHISAKNERDMGHPLARGQDEVSWSGSRNMLLVRGQDRASNPC